MNSLTIIGNLTRDPELRTTPSKKTVCTFDVAVNRRHHTEGQPEADFFRVNAWQTLGELCAVYLSKGKKVCVIGSVALQQRESNGKHYADMVVTAQDVEFLTPNGGESNG